MEKQEQIFKMYKVLQNFQVCLLIIFTKPEIFTNEFSSLHFRGLFRKSILKFTKGLSEFKEINNF